MTMVDERLLATALGAWVGPAILNEAAGLMGIGKG
jgi:hypothetical protein